MLSAKSVIALLLILIGAGGLVLHAQWQKVRPVDRQSAVGDVSELDPEMRAAVSFLDDFELKRAPGQRDWLASHHEPGQSYGQYLRSGANVPKKGKDTLYILPLGTFGLGSSPKLSQLASYTEAYFHPMKVRVLPAVALNDVEAQTRERSFGTQLHSEDTLKWLEGKLPSDAYAMLAVTMVDLYPRESWNYVFGQASLKERVGVFSFARYSGGVGGGGEKVPKELALERSVKVLTHEFGHMFGVLHCIYYQCNMNGSNHLGEVDVSPLQACPVCLRKFHHACGFSAKTRYRKLLEFCEAQGLEDGAKFYKSRLEKMP
ncbi:archaemetzincin [Rubritalea tangerina]